VLQSPGDDEGPFQDAEREPGRMQRPGMGYVIAAYAIIAAAILGYLRSLWLRDKACRGRYKRFWIVV